MSLLKKTVGTLDFKQVQTSKGAYIPFETTGVIGLVLFVLGLFVGQSWLSNAYKKSRVGMSKQDLVASGDAKSVLGIVK